MRVSQVAFRQLTDSDETLSGSISDEAWLWAHTEGLRTVPEIALPSVLEIVVALLIACYVILTVRSLMWVILATLNAIVLLVVNFSIWYASIGTTANWSNPESQNSGKIALVRKFTRNGQQCETLDYRLITKRRPVGPQHFRLSSCLQPDGQWRLI